MTKMLSVLFLVRARRVKVLVKNKPLLALGLLFAVGSFFFGVIKFQTGTIPIVEKGMYGFKTTYSIDSDAQGFCYGNLIKTYKLTLKINNIVIYAFVLHMI